MLIRRMIADAVLEVEEITMSFYETRTRYFYTNIKTWEDLTNPAGTKQVGIFPVRQPMTQGAIDWCKKYHLPKVEV